MNGTCQYTYTKITAHFRSGGGTSLSDKEKIKNLENRISLLEQRLATEETAGLVMLSDSEAVTDSTGLVLPASEKNAALEGTLANWIKALNDGNTNSVIRLFEYPEDMNGVVSNSVSRIQKDYVKTENSPFNYGTMFVFSIGGYTGQIGISVDSGDYGLYYRSGAHGSWNRWNKV